MIIEQNAVLKDDLSILRKIQQRKSKDELEIEKGRG
jgi:hypothetical protein